MLPSSGETPAVYSQHSSKGILLKRPQTLSLLSPNPPQAPFHMHSPSQDLQATRRRSLATSPRFSDLGTLLALHWLFLLPEKLHSVPTSAVTQTHSQ